MRHLRTFASLVVLFVCAARPTAAQIRYPIDGFVWYSVPNGEIVGHCFGNCGAGCSDFMNPCGGRQQYWELQILSEPQPVGGEWWDTECWTDTLMLVRFVPHQAWARWTYYGHAASGCESHDARCPEVFYIGCLIWTGCGPEWDQEWWYEELIEGDKRADVEPIGSCWTPWLP